MTESYGDLIVGIDFYDASRDRWLDDERRIIPHGQDPAWAPNGKRIAFDTNPSCSPSRSSVVLSSFLDGSHRRVLARNASQPAWSPDGLRIAFVRRVSATNTEIYVMNADSTQQRRLTQRYGFDLNPDWQPLPE